MNNVRPFTVDWYEAMRTALDAVDIQNVDKILIELQQQQVANPMDEMSMNPEMLEGLASIMYGGR